MRAHEEGFRIGTFRIDITPPLGHPLCGGWIEPAIRIDDALEAIGFVLLGAGDPIVVCVLDWLGLCNEAHAAWRTALAVAAGTSPSRVAVQCVHQHNAPLVDCEAARLVAQQPGLPPVYDGAFFQDCLSRAQSAVRTARSGGRPITHIATGEAPVVDVASNRRVARDAQGRVTAMRRSACTEPDLIDLPVGLIDPMLKSVAFYEGETKLVSCHYYATHPMSYYADGRVSSDFCGLARKRLQSDEPGCTHLYFTGCAGDLSAGKYNDGSLAARIALTDRIYRGMIASEQAFRREPLRAVEWRTEAFLAEPNPALDESELRRQLEDSAGSLVQRIVPAFKLSSIERFRQRIPVMVSALLLNENALLHLPAEAFVEYQLRAQRLASGRFVACAAYGDDGPFYIPTAEEYPAGGYEVGNAFCDPAIDEALTRAIAQVLNGRAQP
jgi:hypothetical protein